MWARVHRRKGGALAACALVLCAAGCGGNQDSIAPASHQEHSIATLFWVMLGGSAVGFLVVVFLLWLGFARRAKPDLPRQVGERGATRLLVGMGIALPIVLLCALFVWSDLFVIQSTAAPRRSSTSMAVEIVGHEWWWEVRYPGTSAVTANEIHIPIHTRVYVTSSTADVIHSFWVPELNRKIDMIPGYTGHIVLDADRAVSSAGSAPSIAACSTRTWRSRWSRRQHAHSGVGSPPRGVRQSQAGAASRRSRPRAAATAIRCAGRRRTGASGPT